jgi:thiosulfate/3-mercaptopyruvate sulfurtransferase
MTTADRSPAAFSGASPHLVDAAWLAARRSDPNLRVVDVRWYLAGKKGADEYAKGHLPGAVFLDLDRDLSADTGPGRHPIPSAEKLTRTMQRAGVSGATHVVAYDDAAGSIAARVWWLLRLFGHPRVSVLDGGIGGWAAAGHEIERHEIERHGIERDAPAPAFPRGDFVAKPPLPDAAASRVVDKHHVRAQAGKSGVLVLDARDRDRYRGDREPVDARPGHVPGAKNAPWPDNTRDGRMLASSELRALYEALGAASAKEIIVYCGSGVTACHDLLALELAGIEHARLYEGSWSDWAKDATLPAAKGEA